MQSSFNDCKKLLLAAITLAHPLPVAKIVFATNASDTHIGGILQQRKKQGWQPLGFLAGSLHPQN